MGHVAKVGMAEVGVMYAQSKSGGCPAESQEEAAQEEVVVVVASDEVASDEVASDEVASDGLGKPLATRGAGEDPAIEQSILSVRDADSCVDGAMSCGVVE
ncbi:hypothetical protein CDD82_5956 [Ophiocordyceps australis]|uniref:Uncharacterized protein n=1 Tax=Ophiocordyceps australis TaxID=1399860 RepID=A0A2C5YWH2_9HYPO|nr:hypothetical protein CDD82_5956 [Ophiocordyceps australis]